LTGRAAQLSAVALEIPAQAIGHNTIHSIQSGTFLGYLELVNGMLKRIREELGGDPVVVATGGLGELYTANSEYIDAYDPDLTLYGLELIHNHLSNGTA
jgi:type III pantothenate kinase